jgi:hypothetical protein
MNPSQTAASCAFGPGAPCAPQQLSCIWRHA